MTVDVTERAPVARRLWWLLEPIHAVTYFSPEARSALEDAGLRGFWRGYFAGRAAPLGAVGAAPVVASFFSFAPSMVARALPDVWTRATPEAVLAARTTGAVTTLQRVWSDATTSNLMHSADLVLEALVAADPSGRVLGAANAALPVPADPIARLWHGATVVREHRGDGHVAALVAAGIDGCEVLVLRAGLDGARATLQPARGWTDDEWESAATRLVDRGYLDGACRATDAGAALYADVEAATDHAAARPWDHLGDANCERLRVLLEPLAAAAADVLTWPNPIGLPR